MVDDSDSDDLIDGPPPNLFGIKLNSANSANKNAHSRSRASSSNVSKKRSSPDRHSAQLGKRVKVAAEETEEAAPAGLKTSTSAAVAEDSTRLQSRPGKENQVPTRQAFISIGRFHSFIDLMIVKANFVDNQNH